MYKNNIDLIGFVGSEPEKRATQNGTAITNLSLATKASWRNDSGSYEHRTEWHRIVVWGKLAEFAATLPKGAHIEVEGELRYRSYAKDVQVGKKTTTVDIPVTEIHASVIRKLDRNSSSSTDSAEEEAPK